MNPIIFSRLTAFASRVQSLPLLRQRMYWIAAGIVLLLAVAAPIWTVRSLRRAEMQKQMNAQVGFRDPGLEVMFPLRVSDTPANRSLLAPGVRQGFWRLQPRSDPSGLLDVRVTNAGLRLFSVVGGQILATFRAGNREVTRVVALQGDSRHRQARFHYRWRAIHPGVAVLGDGAPELGREYEGEARLELQNDRWRVNHWTTPFDESVARFRDLAGSPR